MTLRNVLIWAVIIVVLFGLYSVLNTGAKTSGSTETSYSQLLREVDEGKIKKATISGDLVEAMGVDGKPRVVVTPANQEALLNKLDAHGVDYGAKRANQVT